MPSASAITRAVVPITIAGLDVAESHDFAARIMSYGPADEFGFRWADGCLDASLSERLPVLTWAHDWADPIGRAVGWERDGADVVVSFALDDVARATQARTQMRSGTITDISVGLTAMELEIDEDSGEIVVTAGTVAECALTLRGAVPGAQVLADTIAFDAQSFRRLMSRAAVIEPVPEPEPTPEPEDEREQEDEDLAGRIRSASAIVTHRRLARRLAR